MAYTIDTPPEESMDNPEITDMQILSKLLEMRYLELHTTIHNPIGMTAVDQGLDLIRAEFGGPMYAFAKTWVQMFRVNMVAEDGNRATGIMKAVAAKSEERKENARDRLLGELSR